MIAILTLAWMVSLARIGESSIDNQLDYMCELCIYQKHEHNLRPTQLCGNTASFTELRLLSRFPQ